MKPDIVYVLKPSTTNEEFRYSLRSLEKNCTNYNKVITIGGMVDGITPDFAISLGQSGRTKYDKVHFTLKEICLNKQIADDFILMNDDFFIMKPLDMSKLESYYRCSMEEYLDIIIKAKCPSEYTGRLARAAAALELLEYGSKCYELHIPMLLNKHKLLEVFGVFTGFCGTRTLYGNYFNIGGKKINDCKVFTCGDDFAKNSKFLSTTDKSFRLGKVGEYIRSQFPKPSRFEQ